MKVETSDGWGFGKTLVAMVILVVLVVGASVAANSGSLRLGKPGPVEVAQGEVVEAMGVKATAQALELEKAERTMLVEMERQRLAREELEAARWGLVWGLIKEGLAGMVLGMALVGCVAMGLLTIRLGVGVWRESRAPVIRVTRVGVGLVAIAAESGKVVVVDEISGERGLLEERVEGSVVRAQALAVMVEKGKPVEVLLGKKDHDPVLASLFRKRDDVEVGTEHPNVVDYKDSIGNEPVSGV